MAVAATTVSAKLYMSFGIRAKMMGMSDEEKEKFQPTYEKVHNAQLNEAEYAPLMVALLLYMHTKGVEAPYAATMAGVSGAIYFWGKVLTGKFIFTPMGALPRFVACILLTVATYKAL